MKELSEELYIQRELITLKRKKIINGTDYNKKNFLEMRNQIRNIFLNKAKKTTILPVEERFLYAISNIKQPKSIIGVGAYFGYALAFMVINLSKSGKAYLIDIDKKLSRICYSNFCKLGFQDNIKIIPEDFFNIYKKLPNTDMVWLDAYGSKSNSIEYQGKRIYNPIIQKLDNKIIKGGIVLAHNVFPFSHHLKHLRGTKKFRNYLSNNFQYTSYVMTPNGIAIGKK